MIRKLFQELNSSYLRSPFGPLSHTFWLSSQTHSKACIFGFNFLSDLAKGGGGGASTPLAPFLVTPLLRIMHQYNLNLWLESASSGGFRGGGGWGDASPPHQPKHNVHMHNIKH